MRAACVLKDRLLKLVCISFPESGQDPASYPTFSRLENAVDVRCCHRMFHVLFKIYLRECSAGGAPEKVLLDFDTTDDPVHGEQEGFFYYCHYHQHVYHPLLAFDGQSGHPIVALLRAGNTHASDSAVAVLKRIVDGLRERCLPRPACQRSLRPPQGLRWTQKPTC